MRPNRENGLRELTQQRHCCRYIIASSVPKANVVAVVVVLMSPNAFQWKRFNNEIRFSTGWVSCFQTQIPFEVLNVFDKLNVMGFNFQLQLIKENFRKLISIILLLDLWNRSTVVAHWTHRPKCTSRWQLRNVRWLVFRWQIAQGSFQLSIRSKCKHNRW